MTTEQATRVVPAGWYEDPSDSDQVRWWNGIAWTDHTQAKPTVAAESDGDELESSFGSPAATARERVRRLATSTSESWLIAFMPAAALVLLPVSAWLYFYVAPNPLVLLIAVVPYILGIVFAVLDVRKLSRWGHRSLPAALWGILGPLVYLLVRALKVKSWGQVATHVLVVAAAAALPIVSSAIGATPALELGLKIQDQIRTELVDSGQASSVACPPIIDSIRVGALYQCAVTLTDGTESTLWVSIDSDEGDFSYSHSLH